MSEKETEYTARRGIPSEIFVSDDPAVVDRSARRFAADSYSENVASDISPQRLSAANEVLGDEKFDLSIFVAPTESVRENAAVSSSDGSANQDSVTASNPTWTANPNALTPPVRRQQEARPAVSSITAQVADTSQVAAAAVSSLDADYGEANIDEQVAVGGFGRAVRWTIFGTVIPGVGLIKSGRKVLGSSVVALFVGLGLALIALVIFNRRLLMDFMVNPDILKAVAVGIVVLALIWVSVIGFSHLRLRPKSASIGQRVSGGVLVALLSMCVLAPMSLGANLVLAHASLVSDVFDDGQQQSVTVPVIENKVDPWAEIPRLNVLIMGADSGTGRSERYGLRPDSNIVASIDTKTGSTTLFSLPRQTARMPFPKDSPLHKYFPNGFYDGIDPKNQEYALNAIYNNVPPQVPKNILGKTKYLPEDIMKVSVGEALGLDIDYFVLINMDGFKDFINALGGITVNVNYPVPIGGNRSRNIKPKGWIEPGPDQHFTGRKALWYARGRYDLTDYNRMERQRCVINAVVHQASPENVLLRYQSIAAAGGKTIKTDIPRDVLPSLVDLASRVQKTKLRSIVFENAKEGFSTLDPNWDKVRERVKKALQETKANNENLPSDTTSPNVLPSGSSPSGEATSGATSTASPSATASPSTKKSAAPKSEDVDDACAYHPEEPKK